MNLILLNLQSNQQIPLDYNNPFIIGRGNVDGCFDKRVSRNHGKISCTLDGKILLVAFSFCTLFPSILIFLPIFLLFGSLFDYVSYQLHCNPCFFTRSGLPPVLQLNKDEEATLNEGDYIGLLPHAFWFKITSNIEAKIKKEADSTRPDLTAGESRNNTLLESSTTSVVQRNERDLEEDAQSFLTNKQNEDICYALPVPASNSEHNLNCRSSQNSSKSFGTPEFEKTKLLPLEMYQIETPCKFTWKSPNKRSLPNDKETNGKKTKLNPGVDANVESQSISEDVIKVENETIDLEVPSTSKIENSHESSKSLFESSESKLQNISPEKDNSREDLIKPGYESHTNNSEDNTVKRPICQYESTCYRQNPQHKLEFCHPGDTDYVTYEERPPCQYGRACYRRNERHRVEFRHPCSGSRNNSSPSSCSPSSIASSPLPAKRRRKKIKSQNLDFEDEDDYDLEDPFINDGSSDEYIPSDVDSEEKEEDLDESQEND